MLATKDFAGSFSYNTPIPSQNSLSVESMQALYNASKALLKPDSWEYGVEQAFEYIGDVESVNRICLLKKMPTEGIPFKIRHSFKWYSDPAAYALGLVEADNIIHNEVFSSWEKQLSAGEVIKKSISKVKSVERCYMKMLNAKSFVAVPVFVKGKWWGVLTFEDCSEDRPWLESELNFFQMFTQLVESAIEGEQAFLKSKEVENRFQFVARATSDALYDWDFRTNEIWRSPHTQILFGATNQDPRSGSAWWSQNIHPKDKERVLNEISDLNKERKNFWTSEYRFRHASGQYEYVLDRAYVTYNENGEPVRMVGSMQNITKQKKDEEALKHSRDQLRQLALHSQLIREEERKHLARELHDEFAQVLTGIKFNLDWLKRKLQPKNTGDIIDCIDEMSDSVLKTMDKVKQTAMALRPTIIDDLGLSEAIRWQVDRFEKRVGCQCVVHVEQIEFDKEIEVAIFRIFQEALSNVARHANASSINVRLQQNGHNLVLQVKDDGVGIANSVIGKNQSIGLLGMQERASAINGDLDIKRLLSGGTSVLLCVPLHGKKPQLGVRRDWAENNSLL